MVSRHRSYLRVVIAAATNYIEIRSRTDSWAVRLALGANLSYLYTVPSCSLIDARAPAPSEHANESQVSAARIAGAIAHELNSPLQGVLSLLTVLSRECPTEQHQLRIAQVRSGLARLSRIIQTFATAYENLPRVPDRVGVTSLAECVQAELAARQLRAEVVLEAPADVTCRCLARELAALLGETCAWPVLQPRTIRVTIGVRDDHATLTCEHEPKDSDTAEPWVQLAGSGAVSGLAVLVDEIARVGGGEAEFRFLPSGVDGIRLLLRREMSKT